MPDAILLKPGPLADEERAVMRNHPEWGRRILSGIPFLADAAEIVCAHQEHWDGRGYPDGLAGEAIPLGARIFAVADTYDAITSDRPCRAGRPYAVARAEIEAGRGTQFDPRVVEVFLQFPEAEWLRLRGEARASSDMAGPLPLWAEPPALPPEFEALNRLIAAVSGSVNLDEILHQAARTPAEVLGAAACALFLYDRESDSLDLAAECGLPEALKARFSRFAVAGFHYEPVVRQAVVRLHGDLAEVPAFVELGLPSAAPDWGAYLCVPLTDQGELIGVMDLFGCRPRAFEASDISLYQSIGEQIGLAIGNARLYESVKNLAITDDLTGAYNRRYVEGFVGRELQRSARYGHGLSFVMLDLDNFKAYNETHGEAAGDEALRRMVRLLRRTVRAVDVIARYGGEEFAVVLPETNAEGARWAAEKIRAAVEAHAFPPGRITASLGLAHCADARDVSAETLIGMADQALHSAKQSGRNCVRVWEPELAGLSKQTEAAVS